MPEDPHIKFAENPLDRFSTLTETEKIEFLRTALADLHAKVISTAKVVQMLVQDKHAQEVERSIVVARKAIPGIRG